jgi:hypothetical protein
MRIVLRTFEFDVPGLSDGAARQPIGLKSGEGHTITTEPYDNCIPQRRQDVGAAAGVTQVRAAHASAQVTVMFFGQAQGSPITGLDSDCSMSRQRAATHGLVRSGMDIADFPYFS